MGNAQSTQLSKLWDRVTKEDRPPIEPEVDDRPVWKTIRIFVSSTFSDFHQEREDLVKKVFAELRIWCEERRIHLIDCDLKWGVPKTIKEDVALKNCLQEIERCYIENKAPYFLNLTCERVGSVPDKNVLKKLEPEFKIEHKVLSGLSVTEMEIVYAAYHINNPNALFLIRDDSFLSQMQKDQTKDFVEKDAYSKLKLEFLKKRINDRFAANGRVKKYTCKFIEGKTLYSDCSGEKPRPALELDSSFSQTILDFFKERIEKQYPLTKGKLDEFEEAKYHHDAFLESREKMVFGRKGVITEIIDYIEKQPTTLPNLILGEAGTGKSSIVARAACQFKKRDKGDARWIVFYHFVGAVPNSASLLLMLRRLLHEIGFGGTLPSTLDRALADVNTELSRNHDDQRFAIFIDALNQLDLDLQMEAMVGWLPETLGRNVRCVLSMITESDAHKYLIGRTNPPIQSFVPQLKEKTRKKIVDRYLGQFKKKLDDKQMDTLMAKKASENCLWLKIACEEMRVFGEFKAVTKLIELLPDSLHALFKQVVRRLEKEADEVLLKSTLCLLEVSKAGLLENELRGLMADKDNLFYKEGEKVSDKERDGILPAVEWALIYHQLKYFLRPYGDSSEGRLDFYHRTLSKVVREMYLSVDSVNGKEEQSNVESQIERDDNKYKWWHRKLANYFVKCRATTESLSKPRPTYVRAVEEYPYHLIELKKLAETEAERDQYCSELTVFLSDMRTFKELFRREYSEILLRYWREAGDETYEKMTKVYVEGLKKMEADNVKTETLDEHYRFVIRFLMQAQKGREGLELLDKCKELVNKTEDESERKQKLIDVLSLTADIRSKLLPRTQSPEQIPELEAIIKVNEDAIHLIESLKAEKDMRLLTAQRLLQTAYTRGGIANRCKEDQSETKAEHLGKSFDEAMEAKRLYQELGDIGQELEAELTLATLYRAKNHTDEQTKICTNAIARCISIFGAQHHMLCRLNYNLGIAYEEADNLNMAYEHYSRAYDLALIVYGPSHANTLNYQKSLEEEQFEEIRAARKLETTLNELWERVTQEDRATIEPEVDDRPVWKTVRIFVSSTFSDFHQEREDLVKKVFAELRIWCEERRVNLIECDLRWGVPKNAKVDAALKICLLEIERCYVENKAPYFLNLTSERVGGVPDENVLEKLEPDFKIKHMVLSGLSVTEMEIVYAAYHINNPNALFLIRDDSFLSQMQKDQTKDFIEKDAFSKLKLEFLKKRVKDRFEQNGRVKKYTCKYIEGKTLYSDCPGEKPRPALEIDSSFSQTILDFFKERIEKQYPLTKGKLDEFEEAKYHHDAFMESREMMVFGRKGVITEIIDYIENQATTLPNLILGEAGTGKSSIVARAACQFKKNQKGDDRWIVFYHFVGTVPNSASLLLMLRRLLHEIGFGENLPSTLDRALTDVNSELARNHDDKRLAIFIDALNQLDLDLQMDAMVGWLPETLGRNVRCVLSMITESDTHKSLIRRTNPPIQSIVPQLKEKTRKKIVGRYLGQFEKKLDDEQLATLLGKKTSENSLWLKIACEEMRVFGEFKAVTNLIKLLPDSLPALLKHVVRRLEKETDEVLLKSTLCLLEVSKAGLLENELRGLMVDKINLFYKKGEKVSEIERDSILPAGEWALIYHQLKYFLRPYGDSSEGRLDFYHRTLSKVVREMYLSVDSVDGKEEQSEAESQIERDDNKYKWWHRKLANYFVKCRATTESLSKPTYMRGVEEYPYHVIELKKLAETEAERDQCCSELAVFLSDMRTFKELFRREFSEILLRYWREAGDETYEKMTEAYVEGLKKMEAEKVETETLDEHYRFVIRLLMQAQRGKEGLELLDKCQKLVNKTEDESERKQKRIDVLSLKADMQSKLLPRTQSPEQIPDLEAIIKVNEEAIELIDSLKAEKDMRFLTAQRLIQTAYTRGGIANRCEEDQNEKKAEHLGKSFDEAKEAKRLYQELGDIGQELEAELTLATLYRAKEDTAEQIKIYTNAIARCTSIFGPQHHTLCRLNYNIGITYEDANDLSMAYEHYSRAYDLALIVYGPSHAYTVNYQKAVDEEQFEEIRAARK